MVQIAVSTVPLQSRSPCPLAAHDSLPPYCTAFQEHLLTSAGLWQKQAQTISTLEQQAIVAVIGPSGSGKSSVVFAGLIPQLRTDQHWLIISFRPGSRPLYTLAAAGLRIGG